MADQDDGATKVILPFPLKGIVRETAIYDQPERTTIDAQNIVLFDPLGRARGAQRPGTVTLWDVDDAV